MGWAKVTLAILQAAEKLIPAAKRVYDEAYAAKYGMTHEEALRRKADIDRRHVKR
jgi:hypothetical protein